MGEEQTIATTIVPEINFIECKFTVESRETLGGSWERNEGGASHDKRITFDGYATSDLYAAIMDAVSKVVGE